MGYLQNDRMKIAVNNMEEGLLNAMSNLDSDGGLINTWAFDEVGNIVLFQELNCGCKKAINKIDIGLTSEDIEENFIIKDDEFIGQIEDLLLEVNYKHDFDNLLFNEKEINSIKQCCQPCK